MNKTSNMGKLIQSLSILAVVLVVQATALPAEAHDLNVVLTSSLGTPTIDGVISPGEWDNADSINFAVNVPEGGTTPGAVFVMHDEDNLYLAIQFARTIVDPGNTATFEFDNDHGGGARENGDDVLLINPSVGFKDEVRSSEPPCPAGAVCGFVDTSLGGTNDGAGAFFNDGTFTVYEFSHPLDSADDANDFSIAPGDTVGFTLKIRIINRDPTFPEPVADTGFPTLKHLNGDLFGDIEIPSGRGALKGYGRIFTNGGMRVFYNFDLQCDPSQDMNDLTVTWGRGNWFSLESLETAVCTDDPDIDPGLFAASFDTYQGTATGRYYKFFRVFDATAEWTFTNAKWGNGEFAEITIYDAYDNVLLSASGDLNWWNHWAYEE